MFSRSPSFVQTTMTADGIDDRSNRNTLLRCELLFVGANYTWAVFISPTLAVVTDYRSWTLDISLVMNQAMLIAKRWQILSYFLVCTLLRLRELYIDNRRHEGSQVSPFACRYNIPVLVEGRHAHNVKWSKLLAAVSVTCINHGTSLYIFLVYLSSRYVYSEQRFSGRNAPTYMRSSHETFLGLQTSYDIRLFSPLLHSILADCLEPYHLVVCVHRTDRAHMSGTLGYLDGRWYPVSSFICYWECCLWYVTGACDYHSC